MKRAREWATRHGLFGPQAFLRYVMFTFLDSLNSTSDDFVFKGGNLLWAYIQTPRATVDLDVATLTLDADSRIRRILEKACAAADGIHFTIKSFESVSSGSKRGASATIAYETDQGAANTFEIDIVYAIPTDYEVIPSPVSEDHNIKAATIENIIADKLTTLGRFGGGNTRMKDFDDLWRLSQTDIKLRKSTLHNLMTAAHAPTRLDKNWINEPMQQAWKSHIKRYKDLPSALDQIFADINKWLKKNVAR